MEGVRGSEDVGSDHSMDSGLISAQQGMGCEGACAHARVQCAVAHVRVRAKRLLKYVCNVRACGYF